MKIGFAQLNTTVGALAENHRKIVSAYHRLVERGAELIITPELAITGYPPQDLVFKSRFVPLNLATLEALHGEVGKVPLLVGFVDVNEGPGQPSHNSAALLRRGEPIHKFHKSLLPTYDVFDEDRYFEPAANVAPIDSLVAQGAQLLVNLSASPFTIGKASRRVEMLGALAAKHRIPIAYCNAVGGNDQLIFDGNSLAFGADGSLRAKLAPFAEDLAVIDLGNDFAPIDYRFQTEPEELHDALVLGLRDYLGKCGFKSAVIGLSGGIDSAVTAALAVRALGPENVTGVTMPTQHSSPGSIDDSIALAKHLGIQCLTVPIQRSFEVFREQFRDLFADLPDDTTEENMQPRLRGMTLMALSNKFGSLLLTTGNKSELAVGYCTLYGDMCGGLAVISDVPKTMVWRLAEWINRDREIIPRATIEKPPSAELKPDQRDQDTLPPYEILDSILELYIEQQLSVSEIVAHGWDEQTVRWVARRVDLNEYKRAQSVPGLKVTSRAFGLGRRMPVAQRFVE